MAPKKHPTKKAAAAAGDVDSPRRQWWPWSELPPTNSSFHPHKLISNLWFHNLSSGPAVTKSYLPPSKQCNAAHKPPPLRHVTTSAAPPTPQPPRAHFLGDGASVVDAVHEKPNATQYWCILKSDTEAKSHPPPTWAETPQNYRVFMSGLKMLVNDVLGQGEPSTGLGVKCTVYRHVSSSVYSFNNVSVWHECATTDPFDARKKFMEFVSVVHYRGSFYAMSLQGAVAVMQVIDTRLTITALAATRAVPSSSSRFFKEYLFEMKGEIMLVFLIHERSLAIVDYVEVFRLDLDKLCWIKVERLKGTLFLKERCIWVDSDKFGCGDDCVYFSEGLEKRWRVFDMKTCCITPVLFGWN